MNYKHFFWFRLVVAVALLVYAGNTVLRFSVLTAAAKAPVHQWEVVFWMLGPPLWFFFEYFFIDHEWIAVPLGKSKEDFLAEVKNYADYASKIWAAVLAVVVFFYAAAK